MDQKLMKKKKLITNNTSITKLWLVKPPLVQSWEKNV